MYSEQQLGVLEEFFKGKPYGSYEEREALAAKLDLQEYQVQVQPHPHPQPPNPGITPSAPSARCPASQSMPYQDAQEDGGRGGV